MNLIKVQMISELLLLLLIHFAGTASLSGLSSLFESCLNKTLSESAVCISNAENKWKISVDMRAPVGQQLCCLKWDLYDCFESGPMLKCDSSEQIWIKMSFSQSIALESKGDCIEYPYHSKSCEIDVN